MPELPEVQTIVSELAKKISGQQITTVSVLADKSVNLSNKKFVQAVVGQKIKNVGRRAKLILVELSGGHWLLIHLKMTGQLVYQKIKKSRKQENTTITGGHQIVAEELPNKFTRVIFEFKDGSKLFFNDIRRFGWIKFVSEKQKNEAIAKYGLEPLSKDFTWPAFSAILKKYPKRKIKQLLLDQSLIAGLGNIYADEVCFAAGVLPQRLSGKISNPEKIKMFKAIVRILKLSISHGGTTARDYVRSDGSKGQMIKYLKVYGRKGSKCQSCNGVVEKIKLNGRGTHFCRSCQK